MKKNTLMILGSGPAGLTAAIYAGRALLNPVIVKGSQPGGQLTLTKDIENYPGFDQAINALDLVDAMERQAIACGAQVLEDHIESLQLQTRPFRLVGSLGQTYQTDALIVATGSQAKWLGLDSEKKFQGYGVSACATCDGFFFREQPVCVVGGGNTAMEEASYLAALASKVTVFHRRAELRAEPLLVQRVLANPKIQIVYNREVVEFAGQEQPKQLTGLVVRNNQTNELEKHACSGCFIAIGHTPNTGFLQNQLTLDQQGYVLLKNPGRTHTNVTGVFAAGDVADHQYRQAVTAAASGCMAALDAFEFLKTNN